MTHLRETIELGKTIIRLWVELYGVAASHDRGSEHLRGLTGSSVGALTEREAKLYIALLDEMKAHKARNAELDSVYAKLDAIEAGEA